MRGRLQNAAWIAAFACLLFSYAAAIWSASQQTPPHNREQPHSAQPERNIIGRTTAEPAKEKDQQKRHSGGHWYDTFLDHTAEWLIAIFTGTLWWSTRKLWLAGERQLRLIEANAAEQSHGMKVSIAVAQQSAQAAELQARTSFQAELPIVLIDSFEVTARPDEPVNQIEIPRRNSSATVLSRGSQAVCLRCLNTRLSDSSLRVLS
jgi:hypothetical protein